MRRQTDFDIVLAFDLEEAAGIQPGKLAPPLRQPSPVRKSRIGDEYVEPRNFTTMEFTADEIRRRLWR